MSKGQVSEPKSANTFQRYADPFFWDEESLLVVCHSLSPLSVSKLTKDTSSFYSLYKLVDCHKGSSSRICPKGKSQNQNQPTPSRDMLIRFFWEEIITLDSLSLSLSSLCFESNQGRQFRLLSLQIGGQSQRKQLEDMSHGQVSEPKSANTF